MALGTFGRATAVFLAVPLGLAGGVFTLALTGINFSVSAAVGFICLAGVAVLNGLVVMTVIRERLENGVPLVEAIREGMTEKMRAVIMTGFVPAIGFVPMAIATGTGAEVQKPLATTVIGDLLAATILARSEEHTSELQSPMRSSHAVFCWNKKPRQHLDADATPPPTDHHT